MQKALYTNAALLGGRSGDLTDREARWDRPTPGNGFAFSPFKIAAVDRITARIVAIITLPTLHGVHPDEPADGRHIRPDAHLDRGQRAFVLEMTAKSTYADINRATADLDGTFAQPN